MEKIKITLPDNSIKEFDKNVNGFSIAKSISQNLLKDSVAMIVNKVTKDLSYKISKDCKIEILTTKNEKSREILNHSAAHIFAQALLRLYKDAKITIGPPKEDGFFYDVDCELKENDLQKIENEVKKIVNENLDFSFEYKTIEKAKNFFKEKNNPYKLKILENILNKKSQNEVSFEGNIENENDKLKFYSQGEFSDLCLGPHIPNTNFVKAFKLLKITKAYFLGDSKNKQLTRVYGTAFFKQKDLDNYLKMVEEAKKRDHRIIAKELDIYTISELVGAGLPMFKSNGVFIRNQIENYLWEMHKKVGYQKVWTPHLAKTDLYKKSGHYDLYEENFQVKGKDTDFMMKPMNCPHHMQIFGSTKYSYKDMPIRFFEPTTVYRDEFSGALTGLTRVRSITQDDGHLFCTIKQIKEEIKNIVKIIRQFYKTLNMEKFFVSLSVRDKNSDKYLGGDEIWNEAEKKLEEICLEENLNYKKIEGEAAFYGPKLDFVFKDCLNRDIQLSTIQLDFNLPKRFDLSFTNEKDKKEMPIVIHRAIAGSLERNTALILENFAGKLPLWLSPNQIKILNVADRHQKKCLELQEIFLDNDFRCDIDFDSETISNKIRLSQKKKYNYIIVIGDKEIESDDLVIRTRKFDGKKNEEIVANLNEFLKMIKKERNEKLIKD